MNLNNLRDEAYSIAKANGWHEEEHSDSHCFMLIITEIAEAVQADRKNLYISKRNFAPDLETEEEWRPVVGYENDYEVSNLGHVRSKDMEVWGGRSYYIKKGRMLKPGKSGTGYYTCALRGHTKKVCQMVAEAFLFKSNPNDVVNHIDGNKLNDNVGNLEYISSSQNNKHALVTGLRHSCSRIPFEDMVDISFRMKYTNEPCSSIYESIKDRIPVTLNAIKNIKQRKRYLKYTDCVEFELADIVIRCLDLAGLREISIDVPKRLYESNMAVAFCMSFTEFCHSLCCWLLALNVPLKERIIQVLERIFLYCKSKDIDLDFFIRTKMKYNRLRGYRHGGLNY